MNLCIILKHRMDLTPLNVPLNVIILLFSLLKRINTAPVDSCNACVEGRCHSKVTLLQNVDITDQLAMDWTNNILYVQLNSVMNTALYLDGYSIVRLHIVQVLETSGMVVRQDTQELFTADHNSNIYKIKRGSNVIKLVSNGVLDGIAEFMFYRNRIYLTKKKSNNIFYFDDGRLIAARDLVNYTITDFVKTDKGVIFVANNTVYEYKRPYNKPPQLLSAKKMVLATDKHENIYLGASSQKVIYKINNDTNRLFIYGAYKGEGSVTRFVFDKDNNIIVHDATEKSLTIWKRKATQCTIVLPHCGVQINVHKPKARFDITMEHDDDEEIKMTTDANDIVHDFFGKLNERE